MGYAAGLNVTGEGCRLFRRGPTISVKLYSVFDFRSEIRFMMDSAVDQSEMARISTAKAIAVTMPEDDLAFFQALWLWVPAGLGLWALIIWTITRFV